MADAVSRLSSYPLDYLSCPNFFPLLFFDVVVIDDDDDARAPLSAEAPRAWECLH